MCEDCLILSMTFLVSTRQHNLYHNRQYMHACPRTCAYIHTHTHTISNSGPGVKLELLLRLIIFTAVTDKLLWSRETGLLTHGI